MFGLETGPKSSVDGLILRGTGLTEQYEKGGSV